jgi:DNA-binding winged helix-turn-helix (wHTH) protein
MFGAFPIRMRVPFGEFTLDRGARQLLRGGEELHLEPKAFELLDLLLQKRPEAVSKPEIRDRLWPETFVSESNLSGLVAQVREALGDDPRQPRYIRTVYGFGYAFAGTKEEPSGAGAPARVAPRVIWGKQIIPLAPGENVLGRDEEAAVRIDSPGVSRRHARILVEKGRAVLEDLDSKNGTFLKEERLEGPGVLQEGDTFRLGRLLLVYRSSALRGSTKTEISGG